MDAVKAFVGYSYLERDKQVVSSFLEFFDSQARDNTKFSWDHAELPEGQGISSKVIEHFADKNCLIAICTKRERVLDEEAAPPLNSLFGHVVVPTSRLFFKTSDWVMQEIGLAIGRKMNLVLLVEDGVRLPPGLQADREWIPFDRSAPHRSFTKLAHILKSLAPVTPQITLPAPVEASSESQSLAPKEPNTDLNLTIPSPSWQLFDYQLAYLILQMDEDKVRAEALERDFLGSSLATSDDGRIGWAAYTERTRIELSQGGSIAALRKLAEQNPTLPAPLENLGRALVYYKDRVAGAEAFAKAASLQKTSKIEAIRLLGRAAQEYARADKRSLAHSTIRDIRVVGEGDKNLETHVLLAIRDVLDELGHLEFSAGATERYLALRPEETNDRFKLAYATSKRGDEELALYHYLTIPERERSAYAWNNLGTGARARELPSLAVRAFQEGVKQDLALAKANLASVFMQAGFLNEAETLCRDALSTEDAPDYASTVMLQISGYPSEEDEKLKELTRRAHAKSSFYSSFGDALLSSVPFPAATWANNELELSLLPKRTGLGGTGRRFTSGLVNAFLQIGTNDSLDKKEKQVSETLWVNGALIGNAFVGKFRPTDQKTSLSALGSLISEVAVLGYIESTHGSIFLMEDSDNPSPTFRKLLVSAAK